VSIDTHGRMLTPDDGPESDDSAEAPSLAGMNAASPHSSQAVTKESMQPVQAPQTEEELDAALCDLLDILPAESLSDVNKILSEHAAVPWADDAPPDSRGEHRFLRRAVQMGLIKRRRPLTLLEYFEAVLSDE
jgi:hypothetical protein